MWKLAFHQNTDKSGFSCRVQAHESKQVINAGLVSLLKGISQDEYQQRKLEYQQRKDERIQVLARASPYVY